MADNNYHSRVVRLGIPDEYVHHGTSEELYADCGFDALAIAAKAVALVARNTVENSETQAAG
jgi:1-deoxy-D-xylulose-5-phosphate synthase